jgi:glycosyltransferase involved in cell wall biosynthesis
MKVKSNTSLLSELPAPPAGKTGWPWTINETSSLIRPASDKLEWPRVSIITPSYNQSQFLEKTIRSVLLQEYPNLDYWLIDGGSTDGSVEIIKKYERWLSGWVSEKDNGQSDAINKGFLRSTGDILAWLNSDDCYLQGCIWTTVKEFSEQPLAGMIYSNVEIIDENDRYLNLFPWRCYNFDDQLTQKMTIPQPAVFWRREVMDRVGLLRPDLHYAMDYEYWIRIGRNFEIVGLEKPMAQFRQTTTSKGSARSSGWGPEYLKILDDIYSIRTIQPEILKLQSKAYAGAYYNGAIGFLTANNIFNARSWIVKSAKYDPSLLLSFPWWYAMAKILLGRRFYAMLRSLKTNMK